MALDGGVPAGGIAGGAAWSATELPGAAQLGDPPGLTHRRVLMLALPMTLAHVTTPLLGLVGAGVIGRLGDAALLGAIAIGAAIFDLVFWTFGSLRLATAGLTAQAVGARHDREIDRTLARAMVMALIVGVALILSGGLIAKAALALSGASPAVSVGLAAYIRVRIFAAPFTLANYAILGSALGRGRTGLGLVLQAAINLLNVGLTLVFVLALSGGMEGAALATVLAEAAGVGFGVLLLARLGSRPWAVPRSEILQRPALLRMLGVNRDVMVRTAALMLAFNAFVALGARIGDVTLAANAVLVNLFLAGGYGLDGFATAAETLCGQALGAGDEARFRRAVVLALSWCVAFGLGVSALLLAIGPAIIDGMTTNAEVRGAARLYLVPAALAPLAGAPAFAFDGIYVGATWTGAMRNLMVIALALYAVILFVTRDLGNAGLWIALLSFLAARGLGQALCYPGLARATFAPTA